MVNFEQPELMRKNLMPGSLVYTGKQKMEKPRIRIFDYNNEKLEEMEVSSINDAFSYVDNNTVTWVNVDGLHDTDLFKAIQEKFKIDPLTLEDILNINQRPKFESREDYLLVVLKSIGFDSSTGKLDIEQISFIQGKNFVFTFQERPGDFFDSVRNRLRRSRGRIRDRGSDYLLYALMDAIVDTYYKIPEGVNELIEQIESRVLAKPEHKDLEEIYNLKRQIMYLEKTLWPLRGLVDEMREDESGLISDFMDPYLRDLYDHSIHLIDALHTFKDMASNLQDLYMTTVSNDMNNVMKVLAVIATIFIPLTFLAGIFGMNFEFMPELKVKGAYYITLVSMLIIAVIMARYFKKKGWF